MGSITEKTPRTGFAPLSPNPLDGPPIAARKKHTHGTAECLMVSALLSPMRDLRAIRGFVSEITLARVKGGRKKNV